MELWTGALSWWKCHWPDLKSAGLFLVRFRVTMLGLKPQHSNPKPNPNSQSTVLSSYSSHTSHHLSQSPCHPSISYATQKLMLDSCKMVEKRSEAFHAFPWHFLQVLNRTLFHIVLLMCQIAFWNLLAVTIWL